VPASSETSSELSVTLPDGVNLHARPAADFVREAMRFGSDVTITSNGRDANAKSLLSVLALGAKGGTALTLRAEGDDAAAAVAALADRVGTLSD
jgi:phosphocarrier protein HPr